MPAGIALVASAARELVGKNCKESLLQVICTTAAVVAFYCELLTHSFLASAGLTAGYWCSRPLIAPWLGPLNRVKPVMQPRMQNHVL